MPTVSLVIPVLSADSHATKLLELLRALQDQDRLPDEVVVAAFRVRDLAKGRLIEIAQATPPYRLRLVENASGAIATGLNLGIQAAESEIILRLDVRARPFPPHIADSLKALIDSGADVVGGRLNIQSGADSLMARAIALAVGHPLGVGDARYRLQSDARQGDVDVVPYACFRKSLWHRLGGFNETLLANEDYEFCWRIRTAGGRIHFDPTIRIAYQARETLSALVRQYFRYGWWKVQMLRQHPTSVRWRQLVPMLTVAGFALSAITAASCPSGWYSIMALTTVYLLAIVWASLQLALRERSTSLLFALPFAFATVHFSWSGGAWANLLTGGRWPSWPSPSTSPQIYE